MSIRIAFQKVVACKMKTSIVVQKKACEAGRRNGDAIMIFLQYFYKLLILFPVVLTVVFIHVYKPFNHNTGNCCECPTALTTPLIQADSPETPLISAPTPMSPPSTPLAQYPQRKSLPPLTIHTNEGQLGNQMFLFATLLGLSTLNGREMAVMPENYYVLSKYFHIDYPIVDDETFVESDPWEIQNWLREEDRNISETSNIIKGELFPTSFTFFQHCRQLVTEVFRFDPVVTRYVRGILDDVKRQMPWVEVYVGVHVRRGDYVRKSAGGWLRAFNGREVDGEYFRKAVQYFADKYENVVFLAVSDDIHWCRKNISKYGINMIPESLGEEYDLAFLAACNHTIMTYGTYGFWGGYLSGGEVVYFADFLKPGTQYLEDYFRIENIYPKEWVGISTTPPGYWDTYVNPFFLD